MIAVDSTSLSLLFIPGAVSNSVKTGKPIRYARERMQFLVDRLAKASDGIVVIPSPVLSEIVVKLSLDQINDLLTTLNSSRWFRVEAFDAAAAIELGTRTARAIAAGDKKEGLKADWTKVKFDRQIVTIAMTSGASEIISDDADIAAICDRWGYKATSVAELALPPDLVAPPLFENVEDD